MTAQPDTSAAQKPRPFSLGPLPLRGVLTGYARSDLKADLRASLPVAAVALPQSMAFAMLAGFPPSYGAWTAVVAGFLGAALGSSRQLVTCLNNAVCMLVTSLFAVMLRQHGPDFDPTTAIVALALLVGVFEIIMGMVGLGDLSRFISGSVLQGFMLGTALLIAVHELPGLLGVEARAAELFPLLREVGSHFGHFNPIALAVGAGSVLTMVLLPRFWRVLPGSLSAVIGSAVAMWALGIGPDRIDMVAPVSAAVHGIASPNVSWELFTDLVPGALAVAILGAVEALVISSSLATQTAQDVDTRWQLVGQGMANIGSGLLHGLPCSSSFTRSFLNLKEGARTQVSAILASLWILVVIVAFGPLVQHVPRAALAGVLLVLAWRLPDWGRIRTMLRATKADRAALLATFFATLVVRLDTALFVGVLISLALYLKKAQTPHLVEYDVGRARKLRQIDNPKERSHPAVCLLHVEGDLFFAAAEVFEREVRRVAGDPALKVLILRMKNARNLDATSALALANLARWLSARGKRLLISGVSGEADEILARAGVIDVIGRENIFSSRKSILESTRDALLFAQKLAGGKGGELRVFRHAGEEGWESDEPEDAGEWKEGAEKPIEGAGG